MKTLFRYLLVTTIVLGLAWTAVGVRVKGRTLYGHANDLGRPALGKVASWWQSFDPKTGVIGIGDETPAKKSSAHHPPASAAPVPNASVKNDENVAHLKKMASLASEPTSPAPNRQALDHLIQKKLDQH
ncbi:MAG: hypothetical protein HY791_18920 [Deltaproteobacteria bacterium]|nr:hypothetical protein [Deltaproteobacteria bacterium]